MEEVGEIATPKDFYSKIRLFRGAILLLLSCLFAWDFCVPKVYYYRDYVERNNTPEGLHELNEEDIAALQIHYRFTEQFYKVQQVECCNSLGKLTKEKYAWGEERPVAMRFEHDYWRNKVLSCDFLDVNGRVVITHRYPDMQTITFHNKDEKGLDMGSGFASSFVKFASTLETETRKPDIKRFEVVRDEKGHIISERFQNDEKFPRQDVYGAYGRSYTRDAEGRILKIRYLSHDGTIIPAHKGTAGYDIQFNEDGLAISLTYVDEKDNPIDGPEYVAKEIYTWKNGNVISLSFYDAHGKPCMFREGYANVKCAYDKRGFLTKSLYFGLNGEPCLNKNGYAGYTLEYDVSGNMVRSMQLDLSGEKYCISNFGCAGLLYTYDTSGNIKELISIGLDGLPCINKMGFARLEREYDINGNETKGTFMDEDGNICFTKENVAHRRIIYDMRGNPEKIMYYGKDLKKLVFHNDGNAGIVGKFDARGNALECVLLGENETPILNKHGYAGWVREYDEQGNVTKNTYKGVSGEIPYVMNDGYAGQTFERDAQGNVEKMTFYGEDGNICMSKDKYASIVSEYDVRGREVKRTYCGLDGAPVLVAEGYAIIKKSYDTRGNVISEIYCGVDDWPCVLSTGYVGIKYEYDSRGNEVKRVFIGQDGKTSLTVDGHTGIESEYDSRGNKTKVKYINEQSGYRVLKSQQFEYNERGNLIKCSHIDADGKLYLDDEGFAGWQSEYDARDNEIKRIYFGADGKPCLIRGGFAGYVCAYDERDNETQKMYLGLHENPILLAEGYSGISMEYDGKGRIIKLMLLGVDGNPINDYSFSGIYNKYSESENNVETFYLDTNGKIIELKNGLFRSVKEIDACGNVISVKYYNKNGILLNQGENRE